MHWRGVIDVQLSRPFDERRVNALEKRRRVGERQQEKADASGTTCREGALGREIGTNAKHRVGKQTGVDMYREGLVVISRLHRLEGHAGWQSNQSKREGRSSSEALPPVAYIACLCNTLCCVPLQSHSCNNNNYHSRLLASRQLSNITPPPSLSVLLVVMT